MSVCTAVAANVAGSIQRKVRMVAMPATTATEMPITMVMSDDVGELVSHCLMLEIPLPAIGPIK